MVFNITVLQKLQEAKVDLFEIIKNNHQYILNCFTRVIEECDRATATVEPKYVDYIQNLKNQWFHLREDYIGYMVYEYKRQLNAWKPWHIITNITSAISPQAKLWNICFQNSVSSYRGLIMGLIISDSYRFRVMLSSNFPLKDIIKRCKQKFTK